MPAGVHTSMLNKQVGRQRVCGPAEEKIGPAGVHVEERQTAGKL